MKINLFLFTAVLLNFYLTVECSKLVAFTFGNNQGDSVKRQIESAKIQNIDLKVIEQEGSLVDIKKLSVMKDYIETMKNENDRIVLFVESGSLFLNSSESIISKFKSMGVRIVLSADKQFFLDTTLQDLFPEVKETEKRFVKVEGLIGYSDTLFRALTEESLKSIKDIQYFFSKLFINPDLRSKFNVKLDSKSEMFQNMDGSDGEVNIEHSPSGEGFLLNVLTDTQPLILQHNGKKNLFNTISNYLGKTWDPIRGCQQCSNSKINLDSKETNKFPNVTVSIFIEYPTSFLSEFFFRISALTYPQSKINMRVSNMVPSYEIMVKEFIDKSRSLYNSLVYLDSSDNKTARDRRLEAIKSCNMPQCDYLLFIDSVVQITNKDTLQILISYNKSILGPLLSRREQLWSNFWGALGPDGYYSRSFDYLDIVNGVKRGIWNIPHIHSMYLMKSELLPLIYDVYHPLRKYHKSEIDMIFSGNMRNKDQFMFVVNENNFGYLIDAENTTEHFHNDL